MEVLLHSGLFFALEVLHAQDEMTLSQSCGNGVHDQSSWVWSRRLFAPSLSLAQRISLLHASSSIEPHPLRR